MRLPRDKEYNEEVAAFHSKSNGDSKHEMSIIIPALYSNLKSFFCILYFIFCLVFAYIHYGQGARVLIKYYNLLNDVNNLLLYLFATLFTVASINAAVFSRDVIKVMIAESLDYGTHKTTRFQILLESTFTGLTWSLILLILNILFKHTANIVGYDTLYTWVSNNLRLTITLLTLLALHYLLLIHEVFNIICNCYALFIVYSMKVLKSTDQEDQKSILLKVRIKKTDNDKNENGSDPDNRVGGN